VRESRKSVLDPRVTSGRCLQMTCLHDCFLAHPAALLWTSTELTRAARKSIVLPATAASISNKPEALGFTSYINLSMEASRATDFLAARVACRTHVAPHLVSRRLQVPVPATWEIVQVQESVKQWLPCILPCMDVSGAGYHDHTVCPHLRKQKYGLAEI
jgi:hypothetical protein